VHCGVDVEKFKSVSRCPEPGKIVCVCNLTSKKGLELAIRACAKLRDKNVPFLYEIVGDGPQRRYLEKLIARLHLENNVRLLGKKPNDKLVELFSTACVFLMPCVKSPEGSMDGIPVAMMEAMACNVPVVSTWISGIPELVQDGVNGYLVSGEDIDVLAETLKKVLSDMDLVRRFGQVGRERVQRYFDIDYTAAQIRNLIVSVLGSHSL
jgi:glycosyltransferase involved in cell wall biosynthesis